MSEEQKIRVLIAKPGLDGHDRGAKVMARGLMDAGFEVVYTGLHQTPLQIVNTAIQEDVDVIGLSILSGAHMKLTDRIIQQMREEGIEDAVVVVGGVIPEEDIPKLLGLGVSGVFTSGTTIQSVCDFIKEKVGSKRSVK
jgi:methylmalonyl-CoA mutase C-terminal domain/subunit